MRKKEEKNMQYTLRPSDLTGHIRVSPSYLTNGSWLVLKANLKDPVKYSTAESIKAFGPSSIGSVTEVSDEIMESVIPKDSDITIKRTPELWNSTDDLDPKRDLVMFEGETYRHKVYFNRRYVQLFNLQTLKGKKDGPWTTPDKDVTIMPVIIPVRKQTKEENP